MTSNNSSALVSVPRTAIMDVMSTYGPVTTRPVLRLATPATAVYTWVIEGQRDLGYIFVDRRVTHYRYFINMTTVYMGRRVYMRVTYDARSTAVSRFGSFFTSKLIFELYWNFM